MSESAQPDPIGLTEEIDQLQSERDRLSNEVKALEAKKKSQSTLRTVGVFILVVLACVSFTGAAVGVWAKRSFLNNEIFAERAAPLGADPAIQAALSVWITDELMQVIDPEELFREALPDRGQILAVPLASAVRGFVQGKVDEFLASERFANLWSEAVTRAHARAVDVVEGSSDVVSAEGDQIEVNLVPLINGALAQVGQSSPEILGRTVDLPELTVDDLPANAQERMSEALGTPVGEDFGVIVIDDNGALSAAQEAVRLFGAAVWILVILTIVLIPLALLVSHRRRRTLLQLVFGLALGLVLVRRLGFRLEGDALDRIANETNRAAAKAITQSFVDPLLDATLIALWILLAVAIVAVVTGPYRWAIALRRGVGNTVSSLGRILGSAGERATDEATVAWLRANSGTLQIGGAAVAVLALLLFDLSWLGLLALLILLVAYEAGVWWIGQSAAETAADQTASAEIEPGPA
jgi:hypothetical protein